MKRSELNAIIQSAIDLLGEKNIPLPDFSKWSPEDWNNASQDYREIVDNMLGWDISDFGSDDFKKVGLTIFTFRNGNLHDKEKYKKPYAEKLLLVNEGQVLPYHFHWSKMEDIINRGGGDLEITLYNADENDEFASTDVIVSMDGRRIVLPAGSSVILKPGQSITLEARQYHSWKGVPGTGKVILFEVSSTNDDMVDNRFHEASGRIPEIDEDEEPKYLIFADYKNYIKF